MDGTCLNKRSRMTDRTLDALKKTADAGILVVPATGRNLGCLPWRIVEEKGLYRYVISSNGAQVTDCATGEAMFQTMMKKETALKLLEDCRKIRVGITSHINHQYLVQGGLLALMGRLIFGKDAKAVYRVHSMEETVRKTRHGIEELQFYFLTPDSRRMIREVLNRYPDLMSAYTSIYVEVFSKETSKGTALLALRESLEISKEETACIGDGENDLPMFAESGLTFAMGNSVPELKKAADFVVPDNNSDGAAAAIERYLLKLKEK